VSPRKSRKANLAYTASIVSLGCRNDKGRTFTVPLDHKPVVRRGVAQARLILNQPKRRRHDLENVWSSQGRLVDNARAGASRRRDEVRGDRAGRALEGLWRRDQFQRRRL